ncbi:29071_t:CDS:2, partial [Racocetra persica]
QQNFVLVNNQQNQLIALPVGFAQPEFHGDNKDHEDFVDREFDNKNWELGNVLDNSGIGATIAHIRGANAGGITGAVASFPNVLLGLTAGERPTNAVLVAPNTGGGIPIILAGIRSGQRLWWIKKYYPTANKYVKMLEIRALRQGIYESVSSFWAKIQKYSDQLGYTPAQKKTYFLSRIRPDIRDEIYRIGQTKPINDIIDSLEELELRHRILQQAPSQPHHAPIAPAIPDFYPIISEKSRQAFYIVDQEGNNIDLLTYPDYLKYLKQAKALFKKLQRSNQSVRMDIIEEGFNET